MRAGALMGAALLLGAAPLAQAQDAEKRWSGSVTAASQYVSRGFRQSWGQPALQGGVDYASPDGWFAGSWASTVSPYFVEGGHVEWDLYTGYASSHGELNYRAGLYYYNYPGAKVSATGTSYNYGEVVLGADWRGWSLAYSITATRDYFGFNSQTLGVGERSHSRGSTYLDLTRRFEFSDGYTLLLHYGWQRVNHFSDYSWTDARVALSRNISGFDVELSYARGWNGAGVYRHYSTGVADSFGRVRESNPIAGTWYFTVGHAF
ncbi:conserved hypothetical protein [Dyella sp. OK004]|uniref:TorF family putative porin n=1 Tax=Dyella sp. OK004 TaxID=1855292 RepID=UPI0008EC2269|nr:TorF family putative porin [Dyella sp. OK004]SFR87425.1 conserved hypothetical protein [Dyella sp. OK004]